MIDFSNRLLRLSHTVVIGLAVVLTFGSCSPPADQPPSAPPPRITLSFIQQRIDEGTPRAQLRVVNRSPDAVTVTGVGLDWAGYGGRFLQEYDTTVPPGQIVDLRVILPSPTCDAAPGPVFGLVETGGTTVRARLDESGQGFVTRTWTRACAEQRLSSAVDIGYGDRWEPAGSGRDSTLRGTLELSRRADSSPIRVVSLAGSVLFQPVLPGRMILPRGQGSASFPLALVPVRCDEHAVGQSTQTFLFRATVRIGASEPLVVPVVPDQRAKDLALALLTRACR